MRIRDAGWRPNDDPETDCEMAIANQAQITMICGCFKAFYSSSIDLFAGLPSPIVQQFDAADQLVDKLRSLLAERTARKIGMTTMTTTLLNQILVLFLRRSLKSTGSDFELISGLDDPQIARAFVDMTARPGPRTRDLVDPKTRKRMRPFASRDKSLNFAER